MTGPPANAWPKGTSGNPRGRPRLTGPEAEAKALLRQAGPRAVIRLTELMESADETVAARAAIGILSKLWPTGVAVEVSGPGGGPIQTSALAGASVTELLEVVRTALGVKR